jgi:hypothetical protein
MYNRSEHGGPKNVKLLEFRKVCELYIGPKTWTIDLVIYTYRQVGVLEQFRNFIRAPSMDIVSYSI